MRSRTTMTANAILLALLTVTAQGCANGSGVEATEVLNYRQCQGLEPGLTRVDYGAVAGIRGGTLLSKTTAPEVDTDDEPLLVAISRGRQPTPGYGFTLEGARRREDTVVVSVRWQQPEADAVQAQMVTHPCLVVGLPGRQFTRVDAVDQSGESLGSLDL